jgi:hypothetical protein
VSTNGNPRVSQAALAELIDSATILSEDHGELVSAAVREAVEHPLDEQRARQLYTRILKILRHHDADELADFERERIADEVRAEVEKVIASVDRPKATGGLELITHNGLTPRDVVPVPTFNNKPIPMVEGYVEVDKLQLWPGNHRLALAVAEFEERNSRPPEPDELLKLMQGSILLTGVKNPTDPFKLKPLADSIARKGVETPPIVTFDGEPKDGNRRIAASLMVVHGKGYSAAEKERARYIRVWRAPKGTTEDQFEAIVVSRNFESDYKEDWPEYIKGRLVVEEYALRKSQVKGRITRPELKRIREELAKDFAIKPGEVERYNKMIYWADDFSAYHEAIANRDPAVVRTKTEKNFQWFYELDAGRGNEKLTRRLEGDDELKAVVYDLMFDVLDSGAQVRDLYRVVNDAESSRMLLKAHEIKDSDPVRSLDIVEDAITEAKRRNVKRRSIGFEAYLKTMVDRMGATPPDQWNGIDTELLLDVKRIMEANLGSIDAQLSSRSAHREKIES